MRNPEITFRSFVYNVALTLIMAACCIAASYVGFLAAVDHVEERETRWEMARGDR